MRRIWITTVLVACGSSTDPLRDAAPEDAPVDAPDEQPFTAGASTLAGAADAGDADGARAVARFANPVDVAYRDGVVYVADFDNNRIRAIDATTHVTTTIVASPGFRRPFGLAFGRDGALFATTDNDRDGGHSLMSGSIWRIDLATGTPTIVANAIGRPRGLGVLSDGRLVVSDYAHHVIELVEPGTGAVTVIAGAWDAPGMVDGQGAAARFATPYGLAVRADDTIVVADQGNHRIRTVTPAGATTPLAGTGTAGWADGTRAAAMFRRPQGVAIAGDELYVTDTDNYRIRRITGDIVDTVAGDGTAGYRDDDLPLAAELYGLEGLAVAADGAMLYVADGGRGEDVPYNRVRQVVRRW